MPEGFPYHRPSRQHILPKPRPQTNVGDGGMHGLWTGRVHRCNADGTVNVWLESGSYLPNVPISSRASGPDRAHDEPIMPNTVVGIQFMWGSKIRPLVTDVIPRINKTAPRPAKPLAYRRLFRSGTHWTVQDSGELELVLADGTFVTIGEGTEPAEKHLAPLTEGDKGDPFAAGVPVQRTKPAPYKLTINMADGSLVQLQNGKLMIRTASDTDLEAAGSVTVHASGPLECKSDTKINVDAPIIALNGGTRPVARAGDPVDVGGFGPAAGAISPLLAGNHTVLA